MPRPVNGDQRYLPGLDGLRALAVMAVVAYHLGLGWVPGGMLGVGVFFTLSGYLITDLLLAQYHRTGRLDLVDFWRRRARRLLPAVLVMLTVVLAWVTALDRSQLPALRGVAISALGYVSNWWLIAQHSSYFARFGPPSPLGHLWSLAVEEQFYLVWPWLLWFGVRWVRRRSGAGAAGPGSGVSGPTGLSLLAKGTLLLALASAIEMALLYSPGYDPTRVYDGTDTRAFALLIGAALAFVWPSRRLTGQVTEGGRRILDAAGGAGLVIIGVLIVGTGQYSAFVYRGGMVLLSVATLLVVGAAASPASRIGQLLGARPLRWIGVRSYGIYLWHYPIIVLTTPASGHMSFVRGTLQLTASILAAALSWKYVEEPVRHGVLGRAWARVRSSGWRLADLNLADLNLARLNPAGRDLSPAGRRRWAAAASAIVVCGVAGAGLTGAVQPGSAAQLATGPTPAPRSEAPTRSPAPTHSAAPARTPAASGQRPGGTVTTSTRTSCRSVVHIGDSTSDGLVSADYLPNPQQRIGAQYAKVGATRMITEISGGRSIVETVGNQANAYDVAKQLVASGYRGCWVLALGTNDTADVVVGSAVSRPARIQKMMSVIGNQPVMWVNVKSLLATGPYAESQMQLWDTALTQACPRYPSMRVYDWAGVAQSRWFISDGIHYTSPGYAARSADIAHALAEAFPAQGSQSARTDCEVH